MIKNVLIGLGVFAVSTLLFGPIVGALFGLGAFALAASISPSPVAGAAPAAVVVPVGGPAIVPIIVPVAPRPRFWHSWSTWSGPSFFARRAPMPHATMNHATILPSSVPHHAPARPAVLLPSAVPHASARPAVLAPPRGGFSGLFSGLSTGRPAASHAHQPGPSSMSRPTVLGRPGGLPGRPHR